MNQTEYTSLTQLLSQSITGDAEIVHEKDKNNITEPLEEKTVLTPDNTILVVASEEKKDIITNLATSSKDIIPETSKEDLIE